MSLSKQVQPITATDDELRAALADAHIPALLPALAQITGDLSLLRKELQPSAAFLAGEQGGLTPELQDEAPELAFQTLKAFRDNGGKLAPQPSDADLHAMMDWMTVGGANSDYTPLMLEELAYPATDARAPQWQAESLCAGRPFSVAIIGSGMSGILAAIRLKQAGIPFTIFEKNADVGGTWLENTYPGARVDSSNHLYSFSFAQKVDWPYFFSTQPVLLEYFKGCATEFGIRPNIRFNTEVLSAAWDDEKAAWLLHVRTQKGEETIEAQALISAVGQLNRPKMPDIAGMNSFEGPSFHSARWNHDVDLTGKRVAVIGNGASASQFIPVVAKQAAHLTVFQRTPSWYVPVPNYHDEVPKGLQWLFTHVPFYAQWYRFFLFWSSAEGLLPMAKVEPGWDNGGLSVGAANQQLRDLFVAHLEESFKDRPDLLPKVIPPYAPASKRIVLDNGTWVETLHRDNVELVTEAIKEITPRGVRTADGVEHEADVIIYGTGFTASKFLSPMQITGRNGIDLNEQWKGDARAYLGIVVPNFPNFFMLYGPNTNIVVNGSIVYFSECEVTYVLNAIRMLLEKGARSLAPKKDVHDAYNVRIDEGNRQMAWGTAKVPSWYRNEFNRVAQNWPFSLLEYWQQTREPNPEDYVLA